MSPLQDFFRANRGQWELLESILARAKAHGLHNLNHEDLILLGRLYRKVASHLAYARTHRLEPELLAYLNNLVGRTHTYIYLPPTGARQWIALFFRRTFPAVLQKRIGFVLLAAVLMLGAGGLGYYLQARAPEAAQAMMPGLAAEVYDRFTKNEWFNDPLSDRPIISAAIMSNNIRVAIIAFGGGILLGLFTVYALYGNGLMLGVLNCYFALRGHGLDFWVAILPHGVIELTAICIAGGAGLLLASALVSPGEYRRRDALVVRGRDAIVLFLGVVVLLVIAGAIEGFISTIGSLSSAARLVVAVASAVLVYPYLFWPRRRSDNEPGREGLPVLMADGNLP